MDSLSGMWFGDERVPAAAALAADRLPGMGPVVSPVGAAASPGLPRMRRGGGRATSSRGQSVPAMRVRSSRSAVPLLSRVWLVDPRCDAGLLAATDRVRSKRRLRPAAKGALGIGGQARGLAPIARRRLAASGPWRRPQPIGCISFSKVNDPKGIRTPVAGEHSAPRCAGGRP